MIRWLGKPNLVASGTSVLVRVANLRAAQDGYEWSSALPTTGKNYRGGSANVGELSIIRLKLNDTRQTRPKENEPMDSPVCYSCTAGPNESRPSTRSGLLSFSHVRLLKTLTSSLARSLFLTHSPADSQVFSPSQ